MNTIKKKIDVTSLRTECPLPNLLQLVGLGQFAKSRCCSPFNQDQKALWGLFQYQGRWMYKDYSTGQLGDEIGLLARINELDAHDNFPAVLMIYQDIVNGKGKGKGKRFRTKAPITPSTPNPKTKPDATEMGQGTYEQIEKLSQLRGITVDGLLFAQERGVLVFGSPWGFEVYGVKDLSGKLIEVRCMNGKYFGASGDLPMRPGHVLSGSQMDWPLGILESKNCDCVALVSGAVELLTLHQYVVRENAQERVAPVAMLSSGLIASDTLEHFRGKYVRIYPCLDKAGINTVRGWEKQLHGADLKKLDMFNFGAVKSTEGQAVKDLCEFARLKCAGSDFVERNILP